jgi:hypothetical protein
LEERRKLVEVELVGKLLENARKEKEMNEKRKIGRLLQAIGQSNWLRKLVG